MVDAAEEVAEARAVDLEGAMGLPWVVAMVVLHHSGDVAATVAVVEAASADADTTLTERLYQLPFLLEIGT